MQAVEIGQPLIGDKEVGLCLGEQPLAVGKCRRHANSVSGLRKDLRDLATSNIIGADNEDLVGQMNLQRSDKRRNGLRTYPKLAPVLVVFKKTATNPRNSMKTNDYVAVPYASATDTSFPAMMNLYHL